MKPNLSSGRGPVLGLVFLGAITAVSLLAGVAFTFPSLGNSYDQVNLVSDQENVALHTDPNLVNAWGLSFGGPSTFWVSDNGTGVSTLYLGRGQRVPLVVTIPLPPGSPAGATALPTGTVYNGSGAFKLDGSHAAQFLFATEDGTISGWNPAVDQTHAILKVDNSYTAVYKGLAIAATLRGRFLYAANFKAGTVDVFDQEFAPVVTAGGFADPDIPAGFAPFNVQNLGGKIYVTYALRDAGGDDVAGPGNGFVDVFDTNGRLLKHLIAHGALNSPWGIETAPSSFGRFAGDLLVGNFGDGKINAYNPRTGAFLGSLEDKHGQVISIDGLWALAFGNGLLAGDRDKLYFTAGPDDEQHGLFGSLAPSR